MKLTLALLCVITSACGSVIDEADPQDDPDGGATAGGGGAGGRGGVAGTAGAGGMAGSGGAPMPPAPASPAVAISEVMYHPPLEDDLVDNHEFVELHNPSGREI